MRDMNDYVLKDWYTRLEREKEEEIKAKVAWAEKAEKYRERRNELDRENKKLRARIRELEDEEAEAARVKLRYLENIGLIRARLIKEHDDGDEDSLFCRFAEVTEHVRNLEWDLESLNQVLDALTKED